MSEKIDDRIYSSIVSDIMKRWKGGKKHEYMAMEWIADRIYEAFIVKRKPLPTTTPQPGSGSGND